MQQGRLFIVSGPSGAGKSSICQQLYKSGEFIPSISMTTRSPRGNEADGVDYYFVSRDKFNETIENDGFLEHAEIYGNCYGTPKAPVLKNLAEGKDVILEIEMDGALQAKKAYPQAITVFVLPPSMKVLRDRLKGRGTETEEQLKIRMQDSLKEISRISEYEYCLINDDFNKAVGDLKEIAEGTGEHKVPDDVSCIVGKYKEEELCYYTRQ